MAGFGGVMSTSDREERLGVRIAAGKAKGELCLKQSEEITEIRRHMTTVYAATDMFEILKRLPEQSSLSTLHAASQERARY